MGGGGCLNTSTYNGPSDEELVGLDLEERKRKRIGTLSNENMDTGGSGPTNTDFTLSNSDCVEPCNTDMATLARKASRSL